MDNTRTSLILGMPCACRALSRVRTRAGSPLEGLTTSSDLSASAAADPPGPEEQQAVAQSVVSLGHWLQEARALHASDMHLTVGSVPRVRVGGRLVPLPGGPVIQRDTMVRLLSGTMPEGSRELWENTGELEFGWGVAGVGRFRVSAYQQRGSPALSVRLIPLAPIPAELLGFPPAVVGLVQQAQGVLLVTGLSGSGKSTTLSGLCDLINRTRECHIITLEDPIEYLHAHNRAIVDQREVGLDTRSFAAGLTSAMGADPDVIIINRVPDEATADAVLRAAEGGKLVIAAVSSSSAVDALEEFFRLLPADRREVARRQLSRVLQGVLAQHLMPRAFPPAPNQGAAPANAPADAPSAPPWSPMVAAFELLVASPQVRALLEEGRFERIALAMGTDESYGMIRMDQSIDRLLHAGLITPESLSLAR